MIPNAPETVESCIICDSYCIRLSKIGYTLGIGYGFLNTFVLSLSVVLLLQIATAAAVAVFAVIVAGAHHQYHYQHNSKCVYNLNCVLHVPAYINIDFIYIIYYMHLRTDIVMAGRCWFLFFFCIVCPFLYIVIVDVAFVFFAAHLNCLLWPTNFYLNKSYLTCFFFFFCNDKAKKTDVRSNWH